MSLFMRLLPAGSRLSILVKSIQQIGIQPLVLLGVYRLGLATGHYRRSMPAMEPIRPGAAPDFNQAAQPGPLVIPAPERLRLVMGEEAASQAITLADEIVRGQVRLFGGAPRPLVLAPPGPLQHWTAYGSTLPGPQGSQDIKFTWEPGRFGWVYSLARAYLLTGGEKYPRAFWQYLEAFLQANPPNLGPNWSSAQEVAIRLLGLTFAGQAFAGSEESTSDRLGMLWRAVESHARRIPATLVYARAQNNNHLVTEALGLLAAAAALPAHTQAEVWRQTGWKWYNRAIQGQVQADGVYIQYSSNYQRLLLQAGLWADALLRRQGKSLPEATCKFLAGAARWLASLVDETSGQASNYGANDSAYLAPLASGNQDDFRPSLQAAGRAFCGAAFYPPGPWDEMSLWFGLDLNPASAGTASPAFKGRLDDPASGSWASLRAMHYSARPSHADQLQVDLWWQGIYILRDPGSYLYNSDPPWDNALAGSDFHNTVTIDGRGQMLRAGRFLWLDWAQARYLAPLSSRDASRQVCAEHNGYAALGINHVRTLALGGAGRWLVSDSLHDVVPRKKKPLHQVRIHWLLPDWEWELDGGRLTLLGSPGRVQIDLQASSGSDSPLAVGLVRAGEHIAGRGQVLAQDGWYAPHYGEKEPTLALVGLLRSVLPVEITTSIKLLPAGGGNPGS